ncbi:MAG: hypothetical protein ACREHV_07550 [Rhizomicrobium sp.]
MNATGNFSAIANREGKPVSKASPNSLKQGIPEGIFEKIRQKIGKTSPRLNNINPNFPEQGISEGTWNRMERRAAEQSYLASNETCTIALRPSSGSA